MATVSVPIPDTLKDEFDEMLREQNRNKADVLRTYIKGLVNRWKKDKEKAGK